jgi:predicted nuclease of predicted toxin-antitoxin system
MSLSLYMDHHIASAITQGLRARGVDILTAYEDGAARMLDAELLDRAGQLGRVLFTQDQDLLSEVAQRQQTGQVCNPEEFFNQVVHLPLR